MRNICLFFQIHLPFRLKKYRFFQIGQDHYYYDDFQTEDRIRYVVENSYLNANRVIADIIRQSAGKFRCAFAISGPAIEQFEQYAPEVIDSFKELANTGCVEFMAQPYAYSLSSVYDTNEFERQVKLHAEKIKNLFGKQPSTLMNAEMIYSDEIGEIAHKMGFKTMIMDEAKHVMGWKSPNYLYNHSYIHKLRLLVRNYKLSDDIAFKFTSLGISAEQFTGWINSLPETEKIINLGMSYEALGVFQLETSGIFEFLTKFTEEAIAQGINFVQPSEVIKKLEPVGSLTAPYPITWAGTDKDLTPWTGNDLQHEAIQKLYAVSERVRLCNDKPLLRDWLLLQSADHFRYISHKDTWGTHYESAYEAFMNYMNVLADFLERVEAQYPTTIENEELNELLKTINHQEEEIKRLEADLKKLRARKAKKEEADAEA